MELYIGIVRMVEILALPMRSILEKKAYLNKGWLPESASGAHLSFLVMRCG